MKFLYRWLGRNIRRVLNEDMMEIKAVDMITSSTKISGVGGHGMNFTVHRADGGYVVETRTYHKKTEHYDHHLHIITDDKDLGQEIGKILMLASMRS